MISLCATLRIRCSAFHDRPVYVEILRNRKLPYCDAATPAGEWNNGDAAESDNSNAQRHTYERAVILQLGQRDNDDNDDDDTNGPQQSHSRTPFGLAFTTLHLTDPRYIAYMHDANPGLGQFFAHFRIQPQFQLVRIGRDATVAHGDVVDDKEHGDGTDQSADNGTCDGTAHNSTMAASHEIRLDDTGCNNNNNNNSCRRNTMRIPITPRERAIMQTWDADSVGNFWREYTLCADGVECRIVEVLHARVMMVE